MARRFAREISGFKFLKGGVDIFEVECDVGYDLLVDVDLEDAECLAEERLGLLVSP